MKHNIPVNEKYSLDQINIGDEIKDGKTKLNGIVSEIIIHKRRSDYSYRFSVLVKSSFGVPEEKWIKYTRKYK